MTVSVTVENYPGLSQVVVDFGLGHAPRNTSHNDVVAAFYGINGVNIDNVGGLRSHEGIWSLNRKTSNTVGNFTEVEMARVRTVAERIAAKG
jgi:hypothetical protein